MRSFRPGRRAPAPTTSWTGTPEPFGAMRRVALPGPGPEDVRFDTAGRVLTGLADGRIVRVDLESGRVRTVADTGGRPLGLCVVSEDELLACDARRGLLRVAGLAAGRPTVEVLVDAVGGAPLGMASNVDRAADGTVWFTVSSRRWPLAQYARDLLEHSCTGRLLRLAPGGAPEVVLDGLAYANGVAVTPDGDGVWVAETGGYRVTRVGAGGVDAGRVSAVADDLPGFPDNVSVGSDGQLWVALAAGRNALLDRLLTGAERTRAVLARLPVRLVEGPRSPAAVVTLDLADGRVRRHLAAGRGGLVLATSVAEREGRVVLGSVAGRCLAVASPADAAPPIAGPDPAA